MAPENKPKDGKLFREPLQPGVILSDAQIRSLVESGQLIIRDTFDERGLDACSYDIRIGAKGVVGGEGREVDLNKQGLEISPGGYAAVVSRECVKLPNDVVARINTKRSVAYLGIALLTGTQIDPGYEGHLLFGFYNASSKKVVLRAGRSICSLVFEALAAPVTRPKPPDPDLLHGNFPDQFINDMANMEVLSLQQLSEEVKQLDRISKELMELRTKYDDVVQPIKALTANVETLSKDVKILSNAIGTMGEQVSGLERVAEENARQIRDVGGQMQALIIQVGTIANETKRVSTTAEKHEEKITDLSGKFATFRLIIYIFWALLLLALGGLFTQYILPKILGQH